jgi:5S rRNA maturation endonuclease (ribonuclease M5)
VAYTAGLTSDDEPTRLLVEAAPITVLTERDAHHFPLLKSRHWKIFVVENPNVLHDIIERLLFAKLPRDHWPSFVCTSGFASRTVVHLLKELLRDKNVSILQSTDGDVAGDAIHEVLCAEFPSRVTRFTVRGREELAVDELATEIMEVLAASGYPSRKWLKVYGDYNHMSGAPFPHREALRPLLRRHGSSLQVIKESR